MTAGAAGTGRSGRELCEFCEISAGNQVARVVYEDEDSLAFFPLEPAAVGHALVIPRRHIPSFLALDPVTTGTLMQATLLVAHALQAVLDPQGMNLISSAGGAASQSVFHLHLHLVPRWHGDLMGEIWPSGEAWVDQVEDKIVADVRAAVLAAGER